MVPWSVSMISHSSQARNTDLHQHVCTIWTSSNTSQQINCCYCPRQKCYPIPTVTYAQETNLMESQKLQKHTLISCPLKRFMVTFWADIWNKKRSYVHFANLKTLRRERGGKHCLVKDKTKRKHCTALRKILMW